MPIARTVHSSYSAQVLGQFPEELWPVNTGKSDDAVYVLQSVHQVPIGSGEGV